MPALECYKVLHFKALRFKRCTMLSAKPNGSSGPLAALHFPAAFHGLEHGDFVGVFDVAAYRNAHGDAGYA